MGPYRKPVRSPVDICGYQLVVVSNLQRSVEKSRRTIPPDYGTIRLDYYSNVALKNIITKQSGKVPYGIL